eukprot:COSAG06_NODE_3546_length_5201_cov_21.568013_5_plen_116_part_00
MHTCIERASEIISIELESDGLGSLIVCVCVTQQEEEQKNKKKNNQNKKKKNEKNKKKDNKKTGWAWVATHICAVTLPAHAVLSHRLPRSAVVFPHTLQENGLFWSAFPMFVPSLS